MAAYLGACYSTKIEPALCLPQQNYETESSEKKREKVDQQIGMHLSKFIFSFCKAHPQSILYLLGTLGAKHKCIFSMELCQDIKSPFSHLEKAEVDNLFMEKGLCVGGVVRHLGQFFKAKSSEDFSFSQNASCFPVKTPMGHEVTFYPFDIDRNCLEEQTRGMRFIQTVYKTSYMADSIEFLPDSVLKTYNLSVQRRIPKSKPSLGIEELIPILKELAEENNPKLGYLLGIKGEQVNHAIALYLQKPYHFMDSIFGVAVANNLEDLLMFLAVFLSENYSPISSFSLLEFCSPSKDSLSAL